ncbi:extracellular solute-binding protein [Candidatus Kaiserbacteria bacterium]|nr:MAG: extracellular solute-binding protein [Candidatus Kaiserbacteria bacterium]
MNIRPFEIILIAVFAIGAIGGLIYFAKYKPESDPTAVLYGDSVVIWGTQDADKMEGLFLSISKNNESFNVVSYHEVEERSFQNELLNAIADGKAPDLIIMPHTLLVTYRTKLKPISFKTITQKAFRDTYIEGAEIFMRSDGIYGVPIAADPLIMYWNRDIFSGSGVASPPKTWETLTAQTTRAINRTDNWLSLTQSAVAFGEFMNVNHAKNILSMLLLQAGSEIVTENEDGEYAVTISKSQDGGMSAGSAVLSFYTQFSTPSKEAYSWNRSKNMDRTEFLEGKLALYFGMGSEKTSLERDNANLNYDVEIVPQGSEATIQRNYADFYALAIPRSSKNIEGAYAVASFLGQPVQAKKFAETFNFAPVHRSLYSEDVADPFKNVLYRSALIARGWLDPNPSQSSEAFRAMVEDALTDQTNLSKIINDTVTSLKSLFNK